MTSQQELLNNLKDHFKLNIYEAKIWTALLSRGIASAGELADISSVPRSRCYDVLESLEKKGFTIMKIGKPIKYIAVKPEAIIERVKGDHMIDAKSQLEQLDQISASDAFQELELLHKSGIDRVEVEDISKSIVGRSAINRQIKEMTKKADAKVIVAGDFEGIERNIKPLRSVVAHLHKNAVPLKIYTNDFKKLAKKLPGAEFNDYKSSTNFVLIDGKEVLFLISSPSIVPEYEVAIWIESPFFVKALSVLFEAAVKG